MPHRRDRAGRPVLRLRRDLRDQASRRVGRDGRREARPRPRRRGPGDRVHRRGLPDAPGGPRTPARPGPARAPPRRSARARGPPVTPRIIHEPRPEPHPSVTANLHVAAGNWAARRERPSHLLAPAVHLNARQIAELFERESGRAFDPDDTQALVAYARGVLRKRFLAAEVGITGVNLAVAETGTLILVESEGNIRLSTGLPRLHVAVMGIEKVVRDWAGAAHLMQLLPLAAHGVPAPASLSLVTGPARDGDDGPEELHLVLVDDGRSALRGTAYESALHCIPSGACLYACPVYRQIGGGRP